MRLFNVLYKLKAQLDSWWDEQVICLQRRYSKKSITRKDVVLERFTLARHDKYIGKKARIEQKERLKQLRSKEKITVAFQVWNITKWKCDSVYRAMEQHPRFTPVIWILDEPGTSPEELLSIRQRLLKHFSEGQYRFSTASTWEELDKEFSPDVTFIQDHYTSRRINKPNVTKNRVLCYVRYCFPNTNLRYSYEWFTYHYVHLMFMENASLAKMCRKFSVDRGRNFVVTGHPMIDYLKDYDSNAESRWKKMDSPRKKVIWAPHWTIVDGPPYSSSTFLMVCDAMIEIAKKYSEQLQIAFKPHPTLYRALCNHPDWGMEKTDAYYVLWNSMPNTQLETGVYRELFHQSDALIHDCGSFIIEYQLIGKPCMFLSRGKDKMSSFNQMNKDAMRCHVAGYTSDDIERFIIEQVLGEKDKLQQRRSRFVRKYLIPPNNCSAAENIINALIG